MTQSCPHCNAQNRDTAQFCAQCAQPLRQICPQCGALNPARSRFCNKCGAPLIKELRCPQCGRLNPDDSHFCNGCGAVLLSTKPQPSPAATGTGMLPPQTMLSGRYIITRCVGRGGMGAVYQAADTRIPGKTWAIKEMSDAAITDPLEKQQARANFRQEALMLARLDHPNLPTVTDHFTEGSKQYLVMDFIEGETLIERLNREGGGPLPADEVVSWAEQLCRVLEYLHGQSPPLIFRDLKPGNVMVTPGGTVKLIDFGIARIFKPGKATDTAYFGTAGYAPKEQYGKGQTDARSDVYALGATLHHLLTGADPADNPFYFEDVRRLNKQVPAGVANCVMKALADDPSDRWQSVTEMRAALTKDSAPKSKPAPRPRSQPRITPAAQPAMAAASVVAPSVAASVALRLDFWRGLGLILLGSALQGVGLWLNSAILRDYASFPLSPLAFIPSLFGVLFGPWIGASVGLLGFLAPSALAGQLWPDWWGLALCSCALGLIPGLMVKEARNWKAVIGAGILTSVVWALSVATIISATNGLWDIFWGFAQNELIAVLPPNLLLLPLFARWLIGPVRRRGLYWREFH
ncbi:MAG: serine/threonine protein kinase [Chloroflexi bacterium]|nr:MAG: serine/threonine protein kinase [Chloroflexota bacterium]